MRLHIVTFCIIVALLFVQAVVIRVYAWPKLKAFIAAHEAVFGVGRTWFLGLKLTITGAVGSLALAIPDLLAQLRLIDLSGTAYAQYAPVVAIVCIVGMEAFHAFGMREATSMAPVPLPAPEPPAVATK